MTKNEGKRPAYAAKKTKKAKNKKKNMKADSIVDRQYLKGR